MRELRREIEIDAPLAAVWAVLTDTRSYSEWNSVIPTSQANCAKEPNSKCASNPPADGL